MFRGRFKCTDPGKMLMFNVNGSLYAQGSLECLDDGTWSSYPVQQWQCAGKLRAHNHCVFVYLLIPPSSDGGGCAQPPIPPPENRLKLVWNGDPTPFGQNVSYVCERGTAFEDDFDRQEFHVRCDATLGNFTLAAWPQCSHSEWEKGHIMSIANSTYLGNAFSQVVPGSAAGATAKRSRLLHRRM